MCGFFLGGGSAAVVALAVVELVVGLSCVLAFHHLTIKPNSLISTFRKTVYSVVYLFIIIKSHGEYK